MKLNFLTSVIYRILILLSAKPNYLNATPDYSLTTQDNLGLNLALTNPSLAIQIKPIDVADDSDSCLYQPNISPYMQSLFEYNSVLNAYKDLDCRARKNGINLLLMDTPDTLINDITENTEKLKINKACIYRPLSQMMTYDGSSSPYTVDKSSDIQFYFEQDLLELRLAYVLNYHKACNVTEVKEFMANSIPLLSLNETDFPDCNSVPIIKEHLQIISSQILSYFVEQLNSALALPSPLYILTLQEIDQFYQLLAREPIIQCRIDNIDYIVRGKLGMKFLVHELSSKIIDGLFSKPYIIQENCIIYSSTYPNSSSSATVSEIKFSDIIVELQKIKTKLTSDETSYRNCGKLNYNLFNLGLDFEKKISPDKIITMCCHNGNFSQYSCSTLPKNYKFTVTKFIDIHRKNYLSQCIKMVDEATRTNQHASRKSRSLGNKKKYNNHSCKEHPLVINSVAQTMTKVTKHFEPNIKKLEWMQNNTKDYTDLCLNTRRKIIGYTYREEINFEFELANYSIKPDEKCFLNGNPRNIKPGLKLAHYKKIKDWAKQYSQTICLTDSNANILFTHSREEGKICIKLGLSYLKAHFTSIAMEMLNSDVEFAKAIAEVRKVNNILSNQIPLDIFFTYLSEDNISELEKDIVGPAFKIESDNRVKKACVDYLLGVLYYKRSSWLERQMTLRNETTNHKQSQLVIEYAKKSIYRFNSHVELLANLGKFSEYERSLYRIQSKMYGNLGNQVEQYHYKALEEEFLHGLKFCSDRFRRSADIYPSTYSESEQVVDATYKIDNSTICTNKALGEYIHELSPLDTKENMEFSKSVFFTEDCNKKSALKSLDLAYEQEKGPNFIPEFSNLCPHTSSSNAKRFFQGKINEQINSNRCTSELSIILSERIASSRP